MDKALVSRFYKTDQSANTNYPSNSIKTAHPNISTLKQQDQSN